MRHLGDIRRHLADAEAKIVCLDPTGGRTVPIPADLADHADQELEVDHPLDLFTSSVSSKIVAGFAMARQNETATVDAPLKSGESKHFRFYDETVEAGCVVVVMCAEKIGGGERPRGHHTLRVRSARYTLDVTGTITDIDENFERLLGWTADDVVGTSSLDITHPDDHEKGIIAWVEMLEHGVGHEHRLRQRFLTKKGDWLWAEDTSTNLLDDPDHGHVSSELLDISDEMAALAEAERREALLTRLAEALPSGVLHVGDDRAPRFWNRRWLELVEHASPSLSGLLSQLVEAPSVEAAIDRAIADQTDTDLDVTFLGDTPQRFGRLHLRPVVRPSAETELLLTLDDTTAARHYQQRLHDLSHRDALTGLLNRNGLRLAVDRLLSDTASGSVLFVDLDRFKQINDTFGHRVGDDVLRAVADVLTNHTRQTDAVARIGGDEFVVLLAHDAATATSELVERIESSLAQLQCAENAECVVSASIGTAQIRSDDTFDSLLNRADQAMYEAKRQRRSAAAETTGETSSIS